MITQNRPTETPSGTLTAVRGVIASADMANALSGEKKQQVIALGQLGWTFGRFDLRIFRVPWKNSPLKRQRAKRAAPRMRRVLTLWDLVFYGIVLIQPIAPIPLFGVAQKLSDGHYVTTILLAMFAMLITAFSYGRMAAIYPSAGSAYTYVGKGLNAYLGFLVGWAMLLDYLLVPLVNGIWVAIAIHSRYLPQLPYAVAMLLVVVFMTAPNLRGIKTSARADKILLVAMCSVTVVFILLAIRFLFHYQGWGGLFSTQPFYNPKTFTAHTVWMATSYAALTYIGFDGVTTLAEDVENPKRNVLLAIVLVCLFTGVFGGFLAYLGQRVWPDWHTLPNLETAFMDVCERVGGLALFHAMGFTILLADARRLALQASWVQRGCSLAWAVTTCCPEKSSPTSAPAPTLLPITS